jgi:hypothetical protein
MNLIQIHHQFIINRHHEYPHHNHQLKYLIKYPLQTVCLALRHP